MAKIRKSATFLLVNEEKTYSQFLKRSIAEDFPEADIQMAQSGETALQLVNRRGFALIISDFALPGMGGVNFLMEVKRIRPDAKIIMLSNHLDKGSKRAIDQIGLFGYLQKPFLMESLSELIARTLDEIGDIRRNGRKSHQGSRY